MNSLVEFFERLVTNFTWSRLTLTFAVLLLLVGSLFGYEAYTQHFALGRLSEQVRIFDQLVTVSERVNTNEKEQLINDSYRKLMTAFNAQVDFKNYLSSKDPSLIGKYTFPEWFTRSVYILFPWAVLGVYLLLSMTSGRPNAMLGLMFIATVFLVIGLLLPGFKSSPWIMKWAYPWGSMIVAIALIVWFDRRKKL